MAALMGPIKGILYHGEQVLNQHHEKAATISAMLAMRMFVCPAPAGSLRGR